MRVSEAEQKQRRMHARVTQLFHVSAVNLYRGRRHSTRRLAVANYSANNPAQPPNFECIKRISAADVGVLSVTLCTFIAILSANTTERGRERERERERELAPKALCIIRQKNFRQSVRQSAECETRFLSSLFFTV
jgi:hypothetical protein